MEHVVTSPTPPFRSADGTVEVHQIPSFQDNLIWLVVCVETRAAAAVDGPRAAEVLAYCEEHGLTLTTIFNTHTHHDHVGINHELKTLGKLADLEVFGPAKKASDVPGINHPVEEGGTARVGNIEGKVWLTEGHIDGHISYLFDDLLFCGDTMFAAGCGYLFDGPPETMHASLMRFMELPAETRVCCAHEYTEDNLRFAFSVEPDNEALAQRIRDVWALRARGECTLPTTIGLEKATNPFVRNTSATLLERVGAAWPDRELDSPAAVFAATRALKDRKDYRSGDDSHLPL